MPSIDGESTEGIDAGPSTGEIAGHFSVSCCDFKLALPDTVDVMFDDGKAGEPVRQGRNESSVRQQQKRDYSGRGRLVSRCISRALIS